MRAPDKKLIQLPDFSGVPDYTEIESACRHAGEIPRSDTANRRHALRGIAKLCTADISDRDLKAVADFLSGRFDRKPGAGRPADPYQQFILIRLDERVQQVRREQHCSRDEAIRQVLDDAKVTDPAARRRMRNYIMKR
jgi:hypothetical protein